uniref:Dehydrogenase/reductase SDR family member 4 n=1 Tax=Gongylonema pulchrum TaxID=637853 RepID=A0A183EKB1_9BILA
LGCRECELSESTRSRFTGRDFEVLVAEALRNILGLAAPSYTLGDFDETAQKGSLIVRASDANLVWSALSLHGQHFGNAVAVHFIAVRGSKGIGKAIALAFVRSGCSVSIVARDALKLESSCVKLNNFARNGAVAKYYTVDITAGYEAIEAVMRKAEIDLGHIDVLVNNAGCSVQDRFELLDLSAFEKQMHLNYLS